MHALMFSSQLAASLDLAFNSSDILAGAEYYFHCLSQFSSIALIRVLTIQLGVPSNQVTENNCCAGRGRSACIHYRK